jgi:hypothetical protein
MFKGTMGFWLIDGIGVIEVSPISLAFDVGIEIGRTR